MGRFAQTFLSGAGIRCRLDVPLHLPSWPLTAEIRHNLFLAFKEALNNVVKHARASEVRISLELLPKGFVLLIADNGCGFNLNGHADGAGPPPPNCAPPPSEAAAGAASIVQRIAPGNGLINMRKRLEEAGGSCQLDSSPGEGMRVKFAISVK